GRQFYAAPHESGTFPATGWPMSSLKRAAPFHGQSSPRTTPAPARRSGLDLAGRWRAAGFKLPAAAWSRIWLLFTALALIKLGLVAGLRKHLYEMHWRTDTSDVTWVNFVAFGLLVALGFFSL